MRPVGFVIVALLGCGAPNASPSAPTRAQATEAPAPSPDPAETAPTDTEPERSVPTDYRIDGETVDEATFVARRGALTVESEPFEHADLINEDESYGGSEASYRAVDGATGERWVLTEVDFVSSSGRRSRGFELSREIAPAIAGDAEAPTTPDPPTRPGRRLPERVAGPAVEPPAETEAETMPAAHVTLVGATRVDQGQAPPPLRRIIEARTTALERCLQREILRAPQTSGTAIVRLAVDGRGAVSAVRAEEETLERPSVVACTLSVLRRLRFRDAGEVAGEYRIELRYEAGPDTVARPFSPPPERERSGLL